MSRNVASKKRKTTPPLGGEDSANAEGFGGDESSQAKRARALVGILPPGPNDKQYFETKLAELEEDLKLIKSAEHPELLEKVSVFEKKKKDDLAKATLVRDLAMKEIEAMFDFAVKEANDVFNNRKKEAQERLQLDTEDAIRRLKEMRDGLAKKKTGGRGRSGSIDDDGSQGDEDTGALATDEAEETQTQGVKRSLRNQGGDRKPKDWEQQKAALSPAEKDVINADLSRMHADWMKRVEAFHSKEQIADLAVRVEAGKLYYNESIIEKGTSVVVHSEATKEDLYGTAQKITPTEGIIRLADGTSSRLLLSNLRAGRAKITRDYDKDKAGTQS